MTPTSASDTPIMRASEASAAKAVNPTRYRVRPEAAQRPRKRREASASGRNRASLCT